MTSPVEAAYHELALTNSRLRAERDELKALHVAAAARAEVAQIEIERLKAERKNCPPASESEYVRRLEDEVEQVGWEVEGFIARLTQRDDANSERLVLEAVSHLRAFSRDCDELRSEKALVEAALDCYSEEQQKLNVEIERLTRENNAHSWDAIVKERNGLRADNERLTALLHGTGYELLATTIEKLEADKARLLGLLFRVRNYIAGERTLDRPKDAMLELIDAALLNKDEHHERSGNRC